MDPIQIRKKPNKEFTCFNCQLDKMKGRNLVLDVDNTIQILKDISYYRLTGYLIDFKGENDHYVAGTKLTEILKLYDMDSKLRKIFFQLLESVEVKLRNAVAYRLSMKYGTLCYLNPSSFSPFYDHTWFLKEILPKRKEKSENKKFMIHHNHIYGGDIPVWVITEILTFENIKAWYDNLKRDDLDYIGFQILSTHPSLIRKWLGPLCGLRNECAHHHRIYNTDRKFIEAETKYERRNVFVEPCSNFAYALACKTLLKGNKDWQKFVNEIRNLLVEYEITPQDIKFPNDWERIIKI